MTAHDITTLPQLHEQLHKAMQLEHATIPPYLQMLYSIRPETNIDVRLLVRVIVVEEMLHLTIAGNLLNAVGGTVDLTQKGFVPHYPAPLPDGLGDFEVDLRAFSKDTIETFLKIERPSRRPAHESPVVEFTGATPLATTPGNAALRYYSIGDFYTAIADGLRCLEAQARHTPAGTIFTGTTPQIPGKYYHSGGGRLEPITDLESALKAIDLVIVQGEGQFPTGGDREWPDVYAGEGDDREIAHFYRFQQIMLGRYYQPGDRPCAPSGPAFEVDWSATYPLKPHCRIADMPEGSDLRAAAERFNRAYADFLVRLTRAFNGEPELMKDGGRDMFRFRDQIEILTRNPLPGTRFNAAPTYEIDLCVPAEEHA